MTTPKMVAKMVVVASVLGLMIGLTAQAATLSIQSTNFAGVGMPTNLLRGSYLIKTIQLQNTNATDPIYYKFLDNGTNASTLAYAKYFGVTYFTTNVGLSAILITNFSGKVTNSIFTNYTATFTYTNAVAASTIASPVVAEGIIPANSTALLSVDTQVIYGLSVTSSVGGTLFNTIVYESYR